MTYYADSSVISTLWSHRFGGVSLATGHGRGGLAKGCLWSTPPDRGNNVPQDQGACSTRLSETR